MVKELVFISQPMNGKSNEEIYAERRDLAKKLEDKGYMINDSILKDTPPEGIHEPIFYLGQSLILLSLSDCVYFMDGWDQARGCKIEHEVAKEYGLPIIHD